MTPLDRLFGVPASVAAALRVLPDIAEYTRTMMGHTEALQKIADSMDELRRDTSALPELRREMGEVAEATRVMDGRMAEIEGAMPVLVEVQQHLALVPDTLTKLNADMERLSDLLERMLGSLDTLSASVDQLQVGVEPLGRVASRWPRRRNRTADLEDPDESAAEPPARDA